MSVSGIFVVIVSLTLSMMLISVLARWAPQLGLMDYPCTRKKHEGGVPLVGGVAIFVACLVPILIWMPQSDLVLPLVSSLSVIFVFGLLDDRTDLNYKVKFGAQFLAAAIIVYGGDVVIVNYPFLFDHVPPAPICQLLTIIFLVAITNAINLSDGLDGLAGGTTLLTIGCLILVANAQADSVLLLFCLAVIGATIGFMRFNSHPAHVFMGDSGSQFLGFCAAVVAIMVTQESNTALSPLVPLLVLGLPILDTSYVMLRRILSGRSPFAADRGHIHHRFLDNGYSHHTSVLIIHMLQVGLVLLAYHMRYASDLNILLVYIAFSIVVLALTSARFTSSKIIGRFVSVQFDRFEISQNSQQLRRLSFQVISALLAVFLVSVALFVPVIEPEFGFASAFLILTLVVLVSFKHFELRLGIIRLCLFTIAMYCVYLLEQTLQLQSTPRPMGVMLFFAFLGLMVAFIIRFWDRNYFGVSALDIIVVAVALILPVVVDVNILSSYSQATIIESLVLLYTVSAIFNRKERLDRVALSGAIAAAGIMCVRSLL